MKSQLNWANDLFQERSKHCLLWESKNKLALVEYKNPKGNREDEDTAQTKRAPGGRAIGGVPKNGKIDRFSKHDNTTMN